ncbi:hypothetical protein F0267_00350 [Vibrio coralliilyticus]|uniref:Uncharacterized protein n=1 Tax=Vibrio coralliilyticus TaxID=190893 RepID=A0AAN0SHT8_9VIBR|nr:hypothetical protein [Vibrio coralliilyticus]AIW22570.1 hypothetical protein IX92_26270 [Vibrio coralliilyticus]NOH36669.1 hypothetical protein [Vibrio coralliilyticus]
MSFERIAITKLNQLLDHANFSKVTSVVEDKIVLLFNANRICEIDKWGRVTWLQSDDFDIPHTAKSNPDID